MSVATLKSAVTQQPKKDLAAMKPAEKVAYLLEARKDSIAAMLPRHLNADRLLKVAQIAATTTPALLECEIPSLIKAIGDCAQMGLEPNTVLGHAYLIPFSAKNRAGQWIKNVQVIIGYKGLIDLARRSGHIVSIATHEVREKDLFELEYGLEEKLRHVPYLKGERGPVIGYYAVAHMKDGGHAFDFMPNIEVMKIRDASQGYKQAMASAEKYHKEASHPWIDHEIEMGKTTAVRRLAKMLPLSVEFNLAATIDDLSERGKQAHIDIIEGECVVNEAPDEYVDPATGEVTPAAKAASPAAAPAPAPAPAQEASAEPAESEMSDVDRLIHRLNKKCKNVDEAGDVMTDPIVDSLAPEDAARLMAAYRKKWAGK
jgi:recombination protein RecT